MKAKNKISAEQVDALHDHLWDYCRKENIFIEERTDSVSMCVMAACKDFSGRIHNRPINIILHKGNKKSTNIIFLAHEAGHFLDYRDNPKGWDEGAAATNEVFEHPEGGYERVVSPERWKRELEAWKRGRQLLADHPHFDSAFKKKFSYWRQKAVRTYLPSYWRYKQLLSEGKQPVELPPPEKAKPAPKKKARKPTYPEARPARKRCGTTTKCQKSNK